MDGAENALCPPQVSPDAAQFHEEARDAALELPGCPSEHVHQERLLRVNHRELASDRGEAGVLEPEHVRSRAQGTQDVALVTAPLQQQLL